MTAPASNEQKRNRKFLMSVTLNPYIRRFRSNFSFSTYFKIIILNYSKCEKKRIENNEIKYLFILCTLQYQAVALKLQFKILRGYCVHWRSSTRTNTNHSISQSRTIFFIFSFAVLPFSWGSIDFSWVLIQGFFHVHTFRLQIHFSKLHKKFALEVVFEVA